MWPFKKKKSNKKVKTRAQLKEMSDLAKEKRERKAKYQKRYDKYLERKLDLKEKELEYEIAEFDSKIKDLEPEDELIEPIFPDILGYDDNDDNDIDRATENLLKLGMEAMRQQNVKHTQGNRDGTTTPTPETGPDNRGPASHLQED